MSLKRKQQDEPVGHEAAAVFRSEPIEDRKSTFIGFFSPNLQPKGLQKLPEIKEADHKVVAWRRLSNQQSINGAKRYVTGSDDDGEKYAGKKLEKVLEAVRAEGNIMVARMYGGIMLGPVRFEHIENCAKAAYRQWQDHETENRDKKRKMKEEEAEHTRLSKALVERDQSIDVLRKLAAEKELKMKQLAESDQESGSPDADSKTEDPVSNAAAKIGYNALPLARLRALDKARDATLSFLLERIDKAEAELASKQRNTTGTLRHGL